MQTRSIFKTTAIVALALSLAACNRSGGNGTASNETLGPGPALDSSRSPTDQAESTTSIFDAFRKTDTESKVAVNKYIWKASLEVLNFMPIQSVDPFTGVIVTGYGTPPGGGRAYRATVLIDDPALDARSLKVAIQNRNGSSANVATVRAIEDAILTRARQLRIADNRL